MFSYNTVLKVQEKLLNGFINYINKITENVKDPYVTGKKKIMINNYIGCIIGKYHVVKAPKLKECVYMNYYPIKNKE